MCFQIFKQNTTIYMMSLKFQLKSTGQGQHSSQQHYLSKLQHLYIIIKFNNRLNPMFFYQFPNQMNQNYFPCFLIPQVSQNQHAYYLNTETLVRNNILISAPSDCQPDSPTVSQKSKISEGKKIPHERIRNVSMEITQRVAGQKKGKKQLYEQEFKPYASETKKGRRTPQNGNRNVVPNIMHQVISFIQKKNKSGKIVERIISQKNLNQVCSVKRYYLYQLLIKDKLNYYVNADSLVILRELQQPSCQVYSQQQQRHYNKISRLLAEYFLKQEFDSIILTSKRVSIDKRLDHLRIKRKILQRIAEMLD